MIASDSPQSRASLRRALGWSLVAGLSVAALTAAFAVVDGSFDETDGRVIATSLGFAVFSATGSAGAFLRLRRTSPALQELGRP
jgi:peptidoglycan/LPS O-acetylase OafA/YrhL